MFKKALIALAALSISTPAGAQHSFAGFIAAKSRGNDKYSITPAVEYACNDDKAGYFDLCITTFITTKAYSYFVLDAKIHKDLAKAKPNILIRYIVDSGNAQTFAEARSALNGAVMKGQMVKLPYNDVKQSSNVLVDRGQRVVIYQSTNDGGSTWSDVLFYKMDK